MQPVQSQRQAASRRRELRFAFRDIEPNSMSRVGQSGSVTKTVLIVEDDESIAMGLEMNLSAEGYRVLVATDGESGLAQAKDPGIDLLILDVMLP